MSDTLIASLQKRIDELTAENATLRSEAKDRRLKGKALREENEQYARALEDLAAERDKYKAAIEAKPGELQATVDELRGRLRDRDHRDRFQTLARKAGVAEGKALDDLWQLSGYKPESDDIDESKITAAIGTALEGRDWLKAAPAPEGTNGKGGQTAAKQTAPAAAHETRSAGPGASRGGSATTPDFDAVLKAKYPNASRLA